MYGRDFGYANSRIVGTVVTKIKDGNPVFVHNVDNDGMCAIQDLRGINNGTLTSTVHLDDLDMSPVKLGYINCAGQAAYVMRVPVRRGPGNQGLRNENSQCSNGRRIFNQPLDAVRNCIMGKYPSFKKAVTDSKSKDGYDKVIAFHRNWAVQNGEILLYKNHAIVGSINSGKPNLSDEYKYLKECLEEIV